MGQRHIAHHLPPWQIFRTLTSPHVLFMTTDASARGTCGAPTPQPSPVPTTAPSAAPSSGPSSAPSAAPSVPPGGCTGCTIEGVCYPSGFSHPTDPCQLCTPSSSTTTWSSRTLYEYQCFPQQCGTQRVYCYGTGHYLQVRTCDGLLLARCACCVHPLRVSHHTASSVSCALTNHTNSYAAVCLQCISSR